MKSYSKDGYNSKNLHIFKCFRKIADIFFVSWKETTMVTTFNNLEHTIESFNILYVFGILV